MNLENLQPNLKELIVNIEDWKYDPTHSIPTRGISDFFCLITFQRDITDEERKTMKKFLQGDAWVRRIGWTEVAGYKTMGLTYKFTTTWDSSD